MQCCTPERVAPVFPPPAAIPLTNEAAVTNDVPLLLGTPTTFPTPAALDMLMTGMLVMPLATVTTAPVGPAALFVKVAELPAPLTKVATAVFDRLPPAAALALLAALITAAWLAATRSEWCREADFPPSAACTEHTETQLSTRK